jgi:hypothetical protein
MKARSAKKSANHLSYSTMKTRLPRLAGLFLLLLLVAIPTARAQPPAAEAVVRGLIIAAQKDQLQNFLVATDLGRIAAHPRHGLSPEELVALLKTIPLEGLTFEVKHSEGKATVRTIGKVRLDFMLETHLVPNQQEGKIVVVAVTP